jgi:hypothetical protein
MGGGGRCWVVVVVVVVVVVMVVVVVVVVVTVVVVVVAVAVVSVVVVMAVAVEVVAAVVVVVVVILGDGSGGCSHCPLVAPQPLLLVFVGHVRVGATSKRTDERVTRHVGAVLITARHFICKHDRCVVDGWVEGQL